MSSRLTTPETVTEDHDARAALAAVLDPIITIDASGIIQSASDSVRRVFGWAPAELIGRNVSVLMPEPQRSAHDGYLERYARTGRTHIINTPRRFDAQRKDGSSFPIELCVSRADVPTRASPLFVGIIRDMTARSADTSTPADAAGMSAGAESAEYLRLQGLVTEQTAALEAVHLKLRMADRLASIGTLAAGLGHDMNNVLLPVRARLNVLRAACQDQSCAGMREGNSSPGSVAMREQVDGIAKSIAYLQQLADGLHYLAKDPDNVRSDDAATDLCTWWKQTGVVIAKAVPKHIKLTASIPAGLPPVSVAPHRLTQAVLNLVVNAGEAIPPLKADPSRKRRQGRVSVWASASSDVGLVLLGVTDNGTGMTAEVKRRAFEIFFTTKARGHGTGLGLPLVYKVATRAGGDVAIESAVGEGTTVTIRLPAASHGVNATAPIFAVITIADGRTAGLVRLALEGAGCAVTAADGPGNADLWLVEPRPSAQRRAAAWLRERQGRRLILLGSPATYGKSGALSAPPQGRVRRGSQESGGQIRNRWAGLEPFTIDDPGDFESIRGAIARALSRPGPHHR